MSFHRSAAVALGLKIAESQLWKTSRVWIGCCKHTDISEEKRFIFCPLCGASLWEKEALEIDGFDEGGGDGGGAVFGYPVIHGLCNRVVIARKKWRVDEPDSFAQFDPTWERDDARFEEMMAAAGLWDEEQFGWWLCNTS